MDYRKIIIGAALIVFAPFSFAGLAQVTPSSAWTYGGSNSSISGVATSPRPGGGFNAPGGVVNVGGRSITMPAASRFASNAPRVLARGLYGHPALLAAAVLGPMIYDHFKDTELEGIEPPSAPGQPWTKSPPGVCTVGPCWKWNKAQVFYYDVASFEAAKRKDYNFCPRDGGGVDPDTFRVYQAGGIMHTLASFKIGNCNTPINVNSVHYKTQGISMEPVTNVPNNPVTENDFINALADKEVPPAMFPHLPFPMPVEPPVLIPGDASVPLPGTMRVPLGQPRQVPGSDPLQYEQEVVDLTQTSVDGDPWWVSTSPKKIITQSFDGVPIPGIDPYPLPETVPVPGPNDPPLPVEQPTSQIDFCINNPSALACQTLGAPLEAVELAQTEIDVPLIAPASGWGASDGACPAPKTVSIAGGMSIAMPYDLICQHARNVRPLILGFAYLAAGLMLIGVLRK